MSKYKRIATEFTDHDLLEQAIKDMGLPFETHTERVIPRYGGNGDMKADFVIRSQNLRPLWNNMAYGDLGFVKEGDRFSIVMDDYDENREPVVNFIGRLRQTYAINNYIRLARARGYAIQKIQEPGGVMRIKLLHAGANRHEIDSQVLPGGEIRATVKGVAGPKCADISKWLDELGTVTEDRQTSDYRRHATVTQLHPARR